MFRKVLFWSHLVAGIVAGIVILVMSFTGTVLAFEKQLVAWSERDARRVAVPDGEAKRLSLEELLAKAREGQPDLKPQSIAISADPADAVAISIGRDDVLYANPYTGEVRKPASHAMHDFMHVMTDWHRWLALSGDQRAVGKSITGISNLAFLFLGLSGLYLWWPRKWAWRALKPSVWFTGAKGKARDWNWHNVIGFWSLPVLIVLTASGAVIGYRWAGNLVFTLAGESAPAQGGPGGGAPTTAIEIPTPAPGTRPLGYNALLASVQSTIPQWETITLRLSAGGRGQGGAPRGEGAGGGQGGQGGQGARSAGGQGENRPAGEGRSAGGSGEGARRGPQPVSFAIREPGVLPATATTTLSLDPFTGAVLRTERFSDSTPGRQARTWLRFLHTGEALGWWGQLIAGLACAGGCVLVYTGFALSWRRFFKKRPKAAATAA